LGARHENQSNLAQALEQLACSPKRIAAKSGTRAKLRFLAPFVPAPSTKARPKKSPAARSRSKAPKAAQPPHVRPRGETSSALILLDQSRLQRAAWAEYHTAQKRHEKAARDLHRHEEVDTPAYEKWLNQTFPVHLTDLRNLEEEVSTKTQQVRLIRAMAAYTGRSAKRLWHEFKDGGAERWQRPDDEKQTSGGDNPRKSARHHFDADDYFDRDEPPPYRASGQTAASRRPGSALRQHSAARDVYRRLVQKLHPDRGGTFTPARERLWHEVQQAWGKGDADWLARLEVELDSTADLGLLGLRDIEPLSIRSPLSRLRRAIAELHAARRDTERKLAEYRKTPPWRFTLTKKKRESLERRTLAQLEKDTLALERRLAHLNKTILQWEEPTLGRSKPRHTLPDW
jgi:hypothetical protein